MPRYGSKLGELSINSVCACVCLPGCRFHGCLPAFASSPTLALRRLWISLIIIGCVMETCGGRCPPPGGLLRMNTVCVCEQVYDNVCATEYLLWIATAVLDSCLRGRIQRGRLPFRRRSKHAPSSCTQRIIGTVYRKHSGLHIITEFGAYI